eukprot:1193844-Prorocentrum_minimum.AAC.1
MRGPSRAVVCGRSSGGTRSTSAATLRSSDASTGNMVVRRPLAACLRSKSSEGTAAYSLILGRHRLLPVLSDTSWSGDQSGEARGTQQGCRCEGGGDLGARLPDVGGPHAYHRGPSQHGAYVGAVVEVVLRLEIVHEQLPLDGVLRELQEARGHLARAVPQRAVDGARRLVLREGLVRPLQELGVLRGDGPLDLQGRREGM